jgi:hypothetical protein
VENRHRGNAAYVIEAVTAAARPVILKVALPPGVDGFSPFTVTVTRATSC